MDKIFLCGIITSQNKTKSKINKGVIMKNISGFISKTLYESGLIKKDEIDSCVYGIDIFLSSVSEVLCILCLSVILHNFFETVLFFMAFIPLRIYAGGYHAKTQLKCFMVSVIVYGIFTVVLKILPKECYFFINIVLPLTSLITTWCFAPIVHHNKNVDKYEQKVYRKISIIICLTECFMFVLLSFIVPQSKNVVSAVLGQTAVTLSMLWVVIKKLFTGGEVK